MQEALPLRASLRRSGDLGVALAPLLRRLRVEELPAEQLRFPVPSAAHAWLLRASSPSCRARSRAGASRSCFRKRETQCCVAQPFAEEWAEQPQEPCRQPALPGLAGFAAWWQRTERLTWETAGCSSLAGDPRRPAGLVRPSIVDRIF